MLTIPRITVLLSRSADIDGDVDVDIVSFRPSTAAAPAAMLWYENTGLHEDTVYGSNDNEGLQPSPGLFFPQPHVGPSGCPAAAASIEDCSVMALELGDANGTTIGDPSAGMPVRTVHSAGDDCV